jgi:hypothetical protein
MYRFCEFVYQENPRYGQQMLVNRKMHMEILGKLLSFFDGSKAW